MSLYWETPNELIIQMCNTLSLNMISKRRFNNRTMVTIEFLNGTQMEIRLERLKEWYIKGKIGRLSPVKMHKPYTNEEIESMCESINMIFIKKYHDEKNHRAYVVAICKKHEYKGEQTIPLDSLIRWSNSGVCKCDHTYRDTEDLKREVNLDKRVEIIGEYEKSNMKILCRCKECSNQWMATPNKLKFGEGCPQCRWKDVSSKNMSNTDEYIEKLKIVQPNIEIIGEYNGAKNDIKYRCKKCGHEDFANASRLLSNECGCRVCKATVGERKISQWLSENNIEYTCEYIFDGCRDKQPLRFDFYLPNKNTCIEFQGEQHYRPVRFRKDMYDNVDKSFVEQQRRDEIKRQYCIENNIKLIEVPYWEINHIGAFLLSKL